MPLHYLPDSAWCVFPTSSHAITFNKLNANINSAAPFQWAAIFHKEDINFKNGHHNLEWYDPSSKSTEHQLPCKVRCSFCHSPIMDEGRNMILLFPSLIKFKSQQDKENFAPR